MIKIPCSYQMKLIGFGLVSSFMFLQLDPTSYYFCNIDSKRHDKSNNIQFLLVKNVTHQRFFLFDILNISFF